MALRLPQFNQAINRSVVIATPGKFTLHQHDEIARIPVTKNRTVVIIRIIVGVSIVVVRIPIIWVGKVEESEIGDETLTVE